MTTKELQQKLFKMLNKQGTYMCFEVAIPRLIAHCAERVDLLIYNTNREWRCFELKVSIADFKSSCKKSFYGHYNYYAMPYELYQKVKDLIPQHIGVYCETGCEKKAIKQIINRDHHELLLFAIMQGLYREYQKEMVQK